MKFNLLINPSHTWKSSHHHALSLAQSMLLNGDEILSVFFYGESSQIAAYSDLQLEWIQLHRQQQFELLICRTMIESQQIKVQLQPEFKIVGMSQLALDMERSDKVVEIV